MQFLSRNKILWLTALLVLGTAGCTTSESPEPQLEPEPEPKPKVAEMSAEEVKEDDEAHRKQLLKSVLEEEESKIDETPVTKDLGPEPETLEADEGAMELLDQNEQGIDINEEPPENPLDKGESILQTTELEITETVTDSEMDSTLSDLSSTDAYSQSTEADSVLQDLDNISGFSSIKLEENNIGEESLASLSKTVKIEETEESRDLLQTITVSRQRTQAVSYTHLTLPTIILV